MDCLMSLIPAARQPKGICCLHRKAEEAVCYAAGDAGQLFSSEDIHNAKIFSQSVRLIVFWRAIISPAKPEFEWRLKREERGNHG